MFVINIDPPAGMIKFRFPADEHTPLGLLRLKYLIVFSIRGIASPTQGRSRLTKRG
jgi:hypothetical protein